MKDQNKWHEYPYSFHALRNQGIFIFEIVHLLVSVAFFIIHFVVALLMQKHGIFYNTNSHSNIAWTFTQFTWWTNIGITLMQFIRLSIRHLNIKNRFLMFIFGKTFYINWVCYILLVGSLFFIGGLWIFLNGDHSPFDYRGQAAFQVLDIVVTIFVHFINPLAWIVLFIFLRKRGYLTFSVEEVQYHTIAIKVALAMFLPLAYMVFYFVFALAYYDPYPLTNLQANSGWWLGPLVPMIFVAVLTAFWLAIRRQTLRALNAKIN